MDNKKIGKLYSRMLADTDQDMEHARKWFRKATADDLKRLWDAIQQDYDDPALEIMSRLAQIQYSELFAEIADKFK